METGVKQIKRKDATKEKSKLPKTASEEKESEPKGKSKYGPMPSFPYQRVFTRGILILGVLTVVYFGTKDGREVALAKQKEVVHHRAQDITCSDDYKAELETFSGCVPKRCGRLVSDKLVSGSEADALLSIAKRGMALGGSQGGATILDLHSGALSQGKNFINIYQLNSAKEVLKKTDFTFYKVVKTKIQNAVGHHFGVQPQSLYLTHPTFFSRLNAAPALTIHDEYWHPHIDKETYESFHYTSLLYLADYGRDFQGGRFVFIDGDNTNRTVEPRKGRVSMFTSGSENVHYVERVTSGTRYALTVSFTCDQKYAIDDPTLPPSPPKELKQ
ncbi:2-oxoglutarate and iron-dependent oxygenase domain-containing protein 3-like [Zootermopsis nevadensis]|uniref:PKHD domain-containing transmembrane protein n=1 Tax=Zootermopsis nevadensis TaxID=136037 RepID=A0A067QVZ2_ZOONE|nr:2-oxoglutarate and iron-dependent oxygenase domain-containing protein 3-like [Zootermopsis nevadensis]KDR14448.1 PKHD domain-containing transmembrane protein [Zootermopsis nevadensis]